MKQEKALATLKRHADALNERMHERKRGKLSDIAHRGYGRALRKFMFLAQEVVPESSLLRSPAFSRARGKLHGLAYHDAVEFLADLESIATDLAATVDAKDHFMIRDAVLACKAQLHSVHVNMHVDGGRGFLLYKRDVGLSMPSEGRVPGEVEEPVALGMAQRRGDALVLQQWMSIEESLAAGRPIPGDEGAPSPTTVKGMVDRGKATHRQLEKVKAFACGALSNFQLVPVVIQDATDTPESAVGAADAAPRKPSASGKTIQAHGEELDEAEEKEARGADDSEATARRPDGMGAQATDDAWQPEDAARPAGDGPIDIRARGVSPPRVSRNA